jgi:hypothetical protein
MSNADGAPAIGFGGMLAGGVVVDDGVNHLAGGDLALDGVEEADPLPSSRSLSSGRMQRGHGGTRIGARARLSLPALDAEETVAQRNRLIADLTQLQSPDEAADWVYKNMPFKNELIAADGDLVATAFRDRLAVIEAETPSLGKPSHSPAVTGGTELSGPLPDCGGVPSPGILEGPAVGLMILHDHPEERERGVVGKTIRLRDKEHCKYVATQRCLICGRASSEAHHIRFAQPRALSRKVSDEYTVPVCRLHHRELHRYGDEASWWAGASIDPLPIALGLWRRSRSEEIKEVRLSDRLPEPRQR